MWHEELTEKSWNALKDVRKLADFVVIGGWGVYFWVKKLKSRDIDICIDQNSFYKLQNELQRQNILVKKNPRLKKMEAVVAGVDVDIYTPFMSNLILPCSAFHEHRWFTDIEGFDVALPEPLLLLKAQVAEERWTSEKGMKDRIDIISLLMYSDWKSTNLLNIIKLYEEAKPLIRSVQKVIERSRAEYRYLGLKYETDGVRLSRSFRNQMAQVTAPRS